jgi:putative hydrolase of the HAD superfamily
MLEFVPSGVSANKIVFAWNSMLKDVPMETIDILIRLKQSKIKVYLLSNTNAIHIDAALRKWGKATSNSFYDMFDKVYLSHEIGLRKPTKEIFDFVIDDQQLIPSKTLFIDDSVQHIEGAKLAGLITHHLKKIDQLRTLFS